MKIKNWRRLADGAWFNDFSKESLVIQGGPGDWVVVSKKIGDKDYQSFENYSSYNEARDIAMRYMKMHSEG